MIRRETTAPRAIEVDRNLGDLAKLPQWSPRLVPINRGAGDDRGSLRLFEDRQRLLDLQRVRCLPGAGAVLSRYAGSLVLNPVAQHVPGQLQEHRSRSTCERYAKRLREIRGAQLRGGHP